jgi:ATP-dependent Clp protease ATP-binding subunit ClpC
LQVLEDGNLTDGKGRRVDFRNTIIIMTSNVGTDQIRRGSRIGFGGSRNTIDLEDTRKKVDDELKRMFRPEFLNRIDATIIFPPLTDAEIRDIARLEVNRVRKHLVEHNIDITITDEALTQLSQRGYDPTYGARPLRRVITNTIEDALAEGMLEGRFKDGDRISIELDENEIRLRNERDTPLAETDEVEPEAELV